MTDPDHVTDRKPLREVEFQILLSVAEQPRHGYGILLAAEQRTDGHPGFEIPTLYRALRRMRREGLIEPVPAPPEASDPRRGYWRATAAGRAAAAAELRRLEQLVVCGRAAGLDPAAGDR